MTVRAIVDQAIGLVVTRNFVEAEDICDALRRFGFGNVIHCRDAALAIEQLAQETHPPAVVLMSFHERDDDTDTLLGLLQSAGARQILINGDAAFAHDRNAAFLQRPFSNTELDRCLAEVMAKV